MLLKILTEELQYLLDPICLNKPYTINGHARKVTTLGKTPVQILETSNVVITLVWSTEVSFSSLKEMAACLEKGPLSRAIESTNMNNQSR